jgi:peptidoglycan hydrolase CwlO-like protein
MSLQQLVKELEAQLHHLKGYTRDQALKMAEYQQDIEGLQVNIEMLNQVF